MEVDRSNVEIFPEWNRRATAAERLREMAVIAEKHPDRFEKMILGYWGDGEQPETFWALAGGMTTVECLGLIDLLRDCLISATKRS